jgi:hypothetical protein
MSERQLILLSPYRLPTQHALVLNADEMAAWMNGYSALWHPAALWSAEGPPRIDGPYDNDVPRAGQIYAIPETPPLVLPDDWEKRARDAGALIFKATPDRDKTLANITEVLRGQSAEEGALLDSKYQEIAPYLGIGFGYLMQATLSEAMEHENLLDKTAFWQAVQRAIAAMAGLTCAPPQPSELQIPEQPAYGHLFDDEGNLTTTEGRSALAGNQAPEEKTSSWQDHLRFAAERLLSAREVLYPVAIHLLDLYVPDAKHGATAWPATFERRLPFNLISSASLLERLARALPERLAALRERIQNAEAEVCGGSYVEREDVLLPIDSQLWNLLKGQAASRAVLGSDIQVFARKHFAVHPQWPQLLNSAGLTRALLLTFDDAAIPQYQAPVVSWATADSKQVQAFTRKPYPVDLPETFFNLGHYLCRTIREDHTATLALVHSGKPPLPWYGDWLELSRLAPVFGQWTTFSRYFGEVLASDHVGAMSADEFRVDYLNERTTAQAPKPVSGFADHWRLRRRLDACWTLAALMRGLAGRNDPQHVDGPLRAIEDGLENLQPSEHDAQASAPSLARRANELDAQLGELEKKVGATLAERLQARAQPEQPGYLVLNPCSFTRRVALEIEGGPAAVTVGGPVKASQLDGTTQRLVVEVPPLGFAWIPRSGTPGSPPPAMRMRLADQRGVRNEFFEAEVDPTTGGLRGILDRRSQINRLGQRLVFNPGSTMRATAINITSAGPALGEVVSEGNLLGEQQQVLARFRQRFRAWLGRPILELRIEISFEQPPAGYPWHAYYGARFAWRDERATMLRGVGGAAQISTEPRPLTLDFLELRLGRQATTIFPGGLPFHQRHQGRMLDMILIPEGETANIFELGIGLDREHPMQTALGMVTPVPLVPTGKGPPHVGASGWLFHLDAPNLLLTGMRPGGASPDVTDAVTVRLLECMTQYSHAEFRCVRDPHRAVLQDARGTQLAEATTSGDTVGFDVAPGDLVQLQIDFS